MMGADARSKPDTPLGPFTVSEIKDNGNGDVAFTLFGQR